LICAGMHRVRLVWATALRFRFVVLSARCQLEST
jgi:hypothetical protein